jgi:hypothetical protein
MIKRDLMYLEPSMRFRKFLKLSTLVMLPLMMLFTSCEGEKLCAGLNNGTGSANNSRSARKGNRGGYKSPNEVNARNRQKKRIKNRQRNSARKSHGGGNTTGGKRGFNVSGGFDIHIGGGGKSKAPAPRY